MKRKDIKLLHGKDVKELSKELNGKKDELAGLLSGQKARPAKNTRTLRILRDDIARLFTVLREKQKEKKSL